MPLVVAIESSSRRPTIAIADAGTIIYDSSKATSLDAADLSLTLSRALSELERVPSDIGLLVVDVGPGGLNAVRLGVSFANGLAAALSIPILPVTSIDILGFTASLATTNPVLVVRGASIANVYMGLFDGGTEARVVVHGTLEQAIARLARPTGKYTVAGRFRQEVIRALPGAEIDDAGLDEPAATDLIRYSSDLRSQTQVAQRQVDAVYFRREES